MFADAGGPGTMSALFRSLSKFLRDAISAKSLAMERNATRDNVWEKRGGTSILDQKSVLPVVNFLSALFVCVSLLRVLVKSPAQSLQSRWDILAEITHLSNLPSRFRRLDASFADCANSLAQLIACLSEKAHPSLLFVRSHLAREVLLGVWIVNVVFTAEIAQSCVRLSQSAKVAETRQVIGS